MFAAGDTVTTPWREWRGVKGSGAVELKWNSDQLVLQKTGVQTKMFRWPPDSRDSNSNCVPINVSSFVDQNKTQRKVVLLN